MRDPKRIDKIINKLRDLWKTYPDLRLGQLIVNLTPNDRSTFYLEDAELLTEIEDYHLPVLVQGDTNGTRKEDHGKD